MLPGRSARWRGQPPHNTRKIEMLTENTGNVTRTDDVFGGVVRPLADLGAEDSALAGGKGALLGELIHGGLPVPPGFVLLTPAYRAFVAMNGFESEIHSLARKSSPADLASTEAAASAIRALFERGAMPDDVERALLDAYAHLGGGAVAVRSSATAEDLPSASFAGQQDSYLNVHGADALLTAIRRCWASLWTTRAITYRARQGIDPADVALAVIVQRMVAAGAAGILFTLNPITGDHHKVVINAAWGLGEAIVGGRVAPDTITVDKATGQIRRIEIGEKAVQTVATADGTADVAVDPPRRRLAVLNHAQVGELTRLGRAIEAHMGAPQDIEWAITGDQIAILQARPVTALSSTPPVARDGGEIPGDDRWPPVYERPSRPYDLWTRANVGENLPHPVSPLTWSALGFLYGTETGGDAAANDGEQGVRRLFGRVYFNEGSLRHLFTEQYGLPSSLLDRTWGSRRVEGHSTKGFQPLRLARSLPGMLRQMAAQRTKSSPRLKPEALFAEIERWNSEFLSHDRRAPSDRELSTAMASIWRTRNRQAFVNHVNVSIGAAVIYTLLEWAVSWRGECKALAHALVTGLSGIYSAEIGLALWRMAGDLRARGLSEMVLAQTPRDALRALRASPAAVPTIERLDAFLARHGHRCPNELELLHPRWAEVPEQVIEMLAGYLRAGDRMNPEAAEARARERREETTATIAARLDPVRRALFRAILGRAHSAVRLRDNSRHFTVKAFFPPRLIYAELGRRWAERGWLVDPDDIFFLAVGEIEATIMADDPTAAGLDLPRLVADRRTAYEHWFQVIPAEIVGPDGAPIADVGDGLAPTELNGLPASGGRVRGRARVIHDPRAATQVRPGDILVTRATDPGWTPVFPLVAGVVLDIGGQLSHGAIVAREYGVPAVVNVHGATERIRDGQMITVDGTTGHVYLDERGDIHDVD